MQQSFPFRDIVKRLKQGAAADVHFSRDGQQRASDDPQPHAVFRKEFRTCAPSGRAIGQGAGLHSVSWSAGQRNCPGKRQDRPFGAGLKMDRYSVHEDSLR